MFFVSPIQEHGYWGAWGAWSKCSKNCHQGKRYRNRPCLYKASSGPVIKVPCKGGSHIHREPCNVDKPCIRKLHTKKFIFVQNFKIVLIKHGFAFQTKYIVADQI